MTAPIEYQIIVNSRLKPLGGAVYSLKIIFDGCIALPARHLAIATSTEYH